MNVLKWVIRPYLFARYYVERFFQMDAFGPDAAQMIKEAYIPTGNPIKDRLHRFHVKQFHESSCSVASVVSVVNSLKDLQGESNNPDSVWNPISQQDLLETVTEAHWKERMSESGYKGRRGLPLNVLGKVVRASLDTFHIHYKSIETIQATRESAEIEACRKQLARHLAQFEKKADCLIIAHFDQGSFLPDMHIPHISPVGGFDPDTGMVKILDVDSTQAFPYQVSFDRFYKGISTDYNAMFRFFGYAEGGYILIRL